MSEQISSANSQDATALGIAQDVLYLTLWGAFAIYELVNIMTCVLVNIGPVFVVLYLFDFTKQFADRWIGQLVTYMILLLLFNIVGTIVLETEFLYVQAKLLLFTMTAPLAQQVGDFDDLDIFLLTGDFMIISLPTIAAAIGGGATSSRGESAAGRALASGSSPSARAGMPSSTSAPRATAGA